MEKSRAIELLEHLAWDRDIERNPYGDALNMAIEALKAQLSCEGTTSDLISRTETVERLREVIEITVPITDHDVGYIDGIETAISTVSTMPTIQPEKRTEKRMETHACDLIDRQAAIDRFNVIRPVDPKKDEYTKGIDVGIAMCIVAVKGQPTVQPERKKGKWVKIPGMNDYCSACNRFFPLSYFHGRPFEINYCPQCGADMRGEQDETD